MKKKVCLIPPASQRKLLRVAAYCRVSTNLPSQETSIEGQGRHFEQLIAQNPTWVLAGIYLDVGAGATRAQKRPELQRLMRDCRAGAIDLVLTKSISRFARNTTDCLRMLRELTAIGVRVQFEKEGICTGTAESELTLSILACLAEEESRALSENVKWGLRKRFQSGTYRSGRAPYGYERRGCDFIVVPDEAQVVRRIFAEALAGIGPSAIARKLNDRGLRTRLGNKWSRAAICCILSNPVYVGDTLYQRTFTNERFMQQANRGELDRYYERNHHEPLVNREDFLLVAKLITPNHSFLSPADEEGFACLLS